MHSAAKAILEVIDGQKEPFKFKELILRMSHQKGINVTHSHLNYLISKRKIERVSKGLYQLKTKTND